MFRALILLISILFISSFANADYLTSGTWDNTASPGVTAAQKNNITGTSYLKFIDRSDDQWMIVYTVNLNSLGNDPAIDLSKVELVTLEGFANRSATGNDFNVTLPASSLSRNATHFYINGTVTEPSSSNFTKKFDSINNKFTNETTPLYLTLYSINSVDNSTIILSRSQQVWDPIHNNNGNYLIPTIIIPIIAIIISLF
ncbi:hypothetical protein DFA_10633 [Cavenderia fasciculata]|uniref:DOMON domain-containing protein n=1 Tax=Cavenderia fasciculata TaxID=261658 RepID=F4QAY8_CACFS|nr:uncharacterized protein DFA_10633 [Cavenderia fasciculata]EGG14760.1 hypothetical protein DFA_10633 [Cavenderia fasciculata]|eukprot:XP_004351276.1 hypothetical protein DFA_10633 [Cavenderia fasciculata]